MEKKWKSSKKLISLLLNIWTNPHYKVTFYILFRILVGKKVEVFC